MAGQARGRAWHVQPEELVEAMVSYATAGCNPLTLNRFEIDGSTLIYRKGPQATQNLGTVNLDLIQEVSDYEGENVSIIDVIKALTCV